MTFRSYSGNIVVSSGENILTLESLLSIEKKIHVADIGAAHLGEVPLYKSLLDKELAHLSAFDADERQRGKLIEIYGSTFDLYTDVIADGKKHTLYLTTPESGMSSILKPSLSHLRFFNEFEFFGSVQTTLPVQSRRLDDYTDLLPIDYLKMDIQGAELMVMQNGADKLKACVLIQLEVSFVPLYENQPCFGQIDDWMREKGFMPHCFVDVKRWSISPTIRDGNFRTPYNQLLEADIVYVKNPLRLDEFTGEQLKTLSLVAFYSYGSVDLSMRCVLELEKREIIPNGSAIKVLPRGSQFI